MVVVYVLFQINDVSEIWNKKGDKKNKI